VLRTPDGCKVTVEHRRGVDPEMVRVALAAALNLIDAEIGAGGRDAA
jgi:hypothetical protein